MEREPYLISLATRLSDGLQRMESKRRDRHVQSIRNFQCAEGGFSGRDGGVDLYYTSFAVRCLSMLQQLDGSTCEHVSAYLLSVRDDQLDAVDRLSWLSSALMVQLAGGPDLLPEHPEPWVDAVLSEIESLRRDDGGYAKTADNPQSSTYHSFLVVLIHELLGRPVPRPNRLVQFVYDRQRDDGGFVEIAPMRRSGTNPTAAAVAILRMLYEVDPETRLDVEGFLRDVKSDEGGFRANTQIPMADLLSTFTGLLTAFDLEIEGVLHPSHAQSYLTENLEFREGGYRAGSWDERADVEYTFYGLGTQALAWLIMKRGGTPA